MSYLHIGNLYKSREILSFKTCYAMEKIHGTSAHIAWKDGQLKFFSGGCKHGDFIMLFNHEELATKFTEIGQPDITVFGEAYGGKLMKMKDTYGLNLRFVAFEVKIFDAWLAVPQAEGIVKQLNLDFVFWKEVTTDLPTLDVERDADSVQAVKCGCGDGKKREGVVLRPPFEVRLNNGDRIIAKYKRDDFQETKTPRSADKDKFEVLRGAEAIANEWVTEMRLTHILDAFPDAGIEKTGDIIKAMIDDVAREAKGEIVDSQGVGKAISRKTAVMFKQRLKNSLANT